MKPRLLPDTRLIPSEQGVVISGPHRTAAVGSPALYAWIERLRPFLDGGRSLDELLADLPSDVAAQVDGVVGLLVREGFVRDAAGDEVHGLGAAIRARHAAMVDFIELQAIDSPEHRFERYRRCAPVVVGSGWLPCAVALALLATGVEFVRVHLSATESGDDSAAHISRLTECAAPLLREDPEARLECADARLDGEDDLALDGAGALLFCAEVGGEPARSMDEHVKALADRSDAAYGRILVEGDRAYISAVDTAKSAQADVASSGDAAPHASGRTSGREGRVSPYLAGPTAALAAHRLCLHLLNFAAGLETDGAEAVLDLATARFEKVGTW
jgi:hypothetical protein